jgi:hypothetical protein
VHQLSSGLFLEIEKVISVWPEISELASIWPLLSEPIQQSILTIARASASATKGGAE